MQETLKLRHVVTHTMRGVLDERDFLEIETPSLTRSTPEGARDYLVPARIDPGSFYALPQSPQLFKQLLMVGGFERYYQIARCFRDEDTRADRQPEFTQLDLEMSFVDEDDVIATMEAVMGAIFAAADFEVAPPAWPRMSYAEAMLRFGSDRPDTRFGLEISELGSLFEGTEFKVFAGALAGGGVIRGLNAGARELPRRELDILTELARQNGAKGLVWAFVQEDGTWRSPVAKALSAEEIAAVTGALEGKPGDLLLIVADSAKVAAQALGALRLDLAERFSLVPEGRHDILWIVDFPMFEQTDDGWTAMHHPFTAPTGDLDGDPGEIMSRAYDLVLDGSEIGGGSIRINTIDVQRKIFGIIGFSEEEAQSRFGFLLDAFRYGAPPHGGIAMGVDRIVDAARRPRLDPRRDRLPEGGLRHRPAHRRAGTGRRRAAERGRPESGRLQSACGGPGGLSRRAALASRSHEASISSASGTSNHEARSADSGVTSAIALPRRPIATSVPRISARSRVRSSVHTSAAIRNGGAIFPARSSDSAWLAPAIANAVSHNRADGVASARPRRRSSSVAIEVDHRPPRRHCRERLVNGAG